MDTNRISPSYQVTWYDLSKPKENQSDQVIRYKLDRAMKLGNLFKETVKLTFRNLNGQLVESEEFVLSVSQNHVFVKGGLSIPIAAITEVTF